MVAKHAATSVRIARRVKIVSKVEMSLPPKPAGPPPYIVNVMSKLNNIKSNINSIKSNINNLKSQVDNLSSDINEIKLLLTEMLKTSKK